MFGWMRGTARGAQAQFQDLGRVYSLAADCVSTHHRWASHPIIQVTRTRVFVDVGGQPYSLDRAKLGSQGHAFAEGTCFYSDAAKRQLESIWAEARTDTHPRPASCELSGRNPLDLGQATTRSEVMTTFRQQALQLHPDHGGDAQRFTNLVEAKNRALARIRR